MTALQNLPGATDLYVYGSRATGCYDAYADLDLQVCVQNQAAHVFWPQFLACVGEIEVAWPLDGSKDNTAFTIFYQGESYYHKVDINLNDTDISSTLPGKRLQLWAQSPAPEPGFIPTTAAYLPVYGSVGYQVFEELISCERYVRARKRGQHLLCWRFVRTKPDKWVKLVHLQKSAWQAHEQTLSTWEIKALDSILPIDDVKQFTHHLAWSEPKTMDAAMIWFTEEITHLQANWAEALCEPLPHALITRHLEFIHNELGL
ncbi:MAG: hypothetical protein ACYCZF_01795 [Anaerolineae bacterium]